MDKPYIILYADTCVREKPVVWFGRSRTQLRQWPAVVRRLAGFQLRRVQRGLEPNDWKAMPTVGIGARELRVHFQGERRLLYVASFPEAVYVLHVFEKKSRKTRSDDLAVARARYIELLAMRRKKHATKSRP